MKDETDIQRHRQRLDQLDRAREKDAQSDIIVEFPRRLLIRSPDGHYWAVTANNSGVLVTTDMGTSL